MKGNIIFLKGKNAAGNLVFYTRAGEQIARARPEFVRNPQTSAQLLRRAYLSFISKMAKGLDSALDLGYTDIVTALVSSRNWFTKRNYAQLSGTVDSVAIAYDKVVLSNPHAEVNVMATGEANFATPLTVILPVDDPYTDDDFGKATDGCVMAVYSKTNGLAVMKHTDEARGRNSIELTVPSYWQGHYVEVWCFMTRGTGSEMICSETWYCGSGRIA